MAAESMFRNVELGRAVLALTNSPFELWFTTSITISPQQHSPDLQQFNQNDLLDYLMSGKCWVCRGNGLCLALELDVQEQPLGKRDMDELGQSIIQAPAWKQLNLHASLPLRDLAHNQAPHGHKVLRININHAKSEDSATRSKSHRLGFNVPFADVRPPEGVPIIALQSVQFSMEFIRTRTTNANKRQKSSKSSRPEGISVLPSKRGTDNIEHPDSDSSDELLLGPQYDNEPRAPDNRGVENLRRSSTLPDMDTTPSNLMKRGMQSSKKEKLKRARTLSTPSTGFDPVHQSLEFEEIGKLIDSALQTAISRGSPKLTQGTKLVTSTFDGGLSEMCPSIWRPAFLPALSQHAHLLPNLNRSIARVAGTRRKSMSIQTPPIEDLAVLTWSHTRLSLSKKPCKPLEPFCITRKQRKAGLNSESDMKHDDDLLLHQGGDFPYSALDLISETGLPILARKKPLEDLALQLSAESDNEVVLFSTETRTGKGFQEQTFVEHGEHPLCSERASQDDRSDVDQLLDYRDEIDSDYPKRRLKLGYQSSLSKLSSNDQDELTLFDGADACTTYGEQNTNHNV